MIVEQMYTGCLAEAAYYIESNGEVAIIDPLRETQPYLEKAAARGAKIKYIFETHFHADFVSGHVDLAKKTGAQIVYGPTAKTGYDSHEAKDGEVFQVGELTLTVLHTPGHTPESSCYLLKDASGKEHCVFTGDTLFIGDVGRPDLAIKGDVTKEQLAGMLYDSLRSKIMPLPNDVTVYPGHGAGSACGKNMSSETFDTLGHQKEVNYALATDMTREAFVKELTEGILPPPQYFPKNAMLNKNGYGSHDEVMAKGNQPLTLESFEKAIATGAFILDTRNKEAFSEGFIPNAVFIGLDGSFATWVGALIEDLAQAIVLITDPGKEEEAVRRLSRVGYDNTLGYLQGGFEQWAKAGKEVDSLNAISAEELANKLKSEEVTVADVRKPGEFESEHVVDAVSFPLDYVNANLTTLDKNKTQYLVCRSGYRSVVAASILKKNGYTNLVDVKGGMNAIEQTEAPLTALACQG